MTNKRSKQPQEILWLDETQVAEPVDPDELLPHWLPTYVASRSFDDNAFSLARQMLGKARGDWTWCLAKEVVARFPECTVPGQAPGWIAGVLWAASVDAGMQRNDELWDHILDDITKMTGASRQTAEQRWEQLKQVGLDHPATPPSYWHSEI
jgi:hypothetical protein